MDFYILQIKILYERYYIQNFLKIISNLKICDAVKENGHCYNTYNRIFSLGNLFKIHSTYRTFGMA